MDRFGQFSYAAIYELSWLIAISRSILNVYDPITDVLSNFSIEHQEFYRYPNVVSATNHSD
jgi:hypothetical protein